MSEQLDTLQQLMGIVSALSENRLRRAQANSIQTSTEAQSKRNPLELQQLMQNMQLDKDRLELDRDRIAAGIRDTDSLINSRQQLTPAQVAATEAQTSRVEQMTPFDVSQAKNRAEQSEFALEQERQMAPYQNDANILQNIATKMSFVEQFPDLLDMAQKQGADFDDFPSLHGEDLVQAMIQAVDNPNSPEVLQLAENNPRFRMWLQMLSGQQRQESSLFTPSMNFSQPDQNLDLPSR